MSTLKKDLERCSREVILDSADGDGNQGRIPITYSDNLKITR